MQKNVYDIIFCNEPQQIYFINNSALSTKYTKLRMYNKHIIENIMNHKCRKTVKLHQFLEVKLMTKL